MELICFSHLRLVLCPSSVHRRPVGFRFVKKYTTNLLAFCVILAINKMAQLRNVGNYRIPAYRAMLPVPPLAKWTRWHPLVLHCFSDSAGFCEVVSDANRLRRVLILVFLSHFSSFVYVSKFVVSIFNVN